MKFNNQIKEFALFACLNKLFIFSHTSNELSLIKVVLTQYLTSRGMHFNENLLVNKVSKGLKIFGWNFYSNLYGKLFVSINRSFLKEYKSKLKLIIKNSYNKKLTNVIKNINFEIFQWSGFYLFFYELNTICLELDLYVNKILWRFVKRYYPRRTNNWIFSRYWRKFSGVWKFFVIDDTNESKFIFLRSHKLVLKKIFFFSKSFNVFNAFNKEKLYEVLFNQNLVNFLGNYKLLFFEQKGLCYVCKRPIFYKNYSILNTYSKLHIKNNLLDLVLVHSYCKGLSL